MLFTWIKYVIFQKSLNVQVAHVKTGLTAWRTSGHMSVPVRMATTEHIAKQVR